MFFRLLWPPAAAILHKDLSLIGLFKNLPGGSWEHAASLPEVSREASREASWETPGRILGASWETVRDSHFRFQPPPFYTRI